MKKILYWCGAIATISAIVIPTWAAMGWKLPPWPTYNTIETLDEKIEEIGSRTRDLQSRDFLRQQQYLDDKRL